MLENKNDLLKSVKKCKQCRTSYPENWSSLVYLHLCMPAALTYRSKAEAAPSTYIMSMVWTLYGLRALISWSLVITMTLAGNQRRIKS